jgi:hypothetical protein
VAPVSGWVAATRSWSPPSRRSSTARAEIGYAADVVLSGNRFPAPRGTITIRESRSVRLENNTLGDARLERVEQIQVPDEATRRAITVTGSRP